MDFLGCQQGEQPAKNNKASKENVPLWNGSLLYSPAPAPYADFESAGEGLGERDQRSRERDGYGLVNTPTKYPPGHRRWKAASRCPTPKAFLCSKAKKQYKKTVAMKAMA